MAAGPWGERGFPPLLSSLEIRKSQKKKKIKIFFLNNKKKWGGNQMWKSNQINFFYILLFFSFKFDRVGLNFGILFFVPGVT